ncbi:hypothetical protein FXF51_01690 [Nonomuraea sp. PA05]|uniref:DUF6197 family protein n=1 Tax=Nonomuraea sp. PA05 TaxID=2604466 RepID=UPI0011DBDD7D|nr:hypothetical protein [Nonomuraea sp. PA05]TYB71174.1 hypothetical protein FXF51_01690 [Nonomuraea sp. PA05]
MITTTDVTDVTPDMIRPKAQAVLRRDGWIQDNYADRRTGKRGVCLVEAIGRAAGLPPFTLARKKLRRADAHLHPQWEAAHNLIDELATHLGRDPENDELTPRWWLTQWNDWCDRTPEQVLAALEPPAVEKA